MTDDDYAWRIRDAAIRWLKARDEWQAAKDFHSRVWNEVDCEYQKDTGSVRCYGRKVSCHPHPEAEDQSGWRRSWQSEWCPACTRTWELRQEVVRLARKKGAAQGCLTKTTRKAMA